jgi:hypothetical protein
VDAWIETYARLTVASRNTRANRIFYRGHSNASWNLKPGLARISSTQRDQVLKLRESNAYFDFITRAGNLLSDPRDSWATIFAMQHHGLPTRLLDWTETLGVALYFALREGEGDAAVWILNPFQLNRASIRKAELFHPHELEGTYEDYFILNTVACPGRVVALTPLRHNPRVSQQRAGFTLHNDLDTPLDELDLGVLQKVVIPSEARAGGLEFLRMAGISEFTLFPDLDGLAREIRRDLEW